MSRKLLGHDRRSFIQSSVALGASMVLSPSANALQSSDLPQPPVPISPPTGGASTQEGEWDLYSRGTEGKTDFVQTIAFTLSVLKLSGPVMTFLLSRTLSILRWPNKVSIEESLSLGARDQRLDLGRGLVPVDARSSVFHTGTCGAVAR